LGTGRPEVASTTCPTMSPPGRPSGREGDGIPGVGCCIAMQIAITPNWAIMVLLSPASVILEFLS
jgi:hypothetical protein